MDSFSRKRKLVELNKNITPSERQIYYKASVSTDGCDYDVCNKYQKVQPMLLLPKVPPRSYSLNGRYEKTHPEESPNGNCKCSKISGAKGPIYVCTCTNFSNERTEWYPPDGKEMNGKFGRRETLACTSSKYPSGYKDWHPVEEESAPYVSCHFSTEESTNQSCNCGREWSQGPEEIRTTSEKCSKCSDGSTKTYTCTCRNYQWSMMYDNPSHSSRSPVQNILPDKPFKKLEAIEESYGSDQEGRGGGKRKGTSALRKEITNESGLGHEYDRKNIKMWFTTEYIEDILSHELCKESSYRLSDSFCRKYDINPTGREILIDWLVNVQVHLKAENSTLHLAVALLDILLDSIHIPLQELQAAAVAAFWVAYKFVHGSISIKTLLNLCANSVTKEMIQDHEVLVIQTSRLIQTGGSLTVFYNYLLFKLFGYKFPPDIYYCGLYLIEIMLIQFVFVECPANEKAITALFTALTLFNYDIHFGFPEISKFITKTKLHLLFKRLLRFLRLFYKDKDTLKNSSVFRKYKSSRYMKISVHENLKCLAFP